MPAYIIRIIVLLSLMILASFAYERHYANKSTATTGQILAISSQAKGKEMAVLLQGEGAATGVRSFTVGPIINAFNRYRVGDTLCIQYCSTCYPSAKIGDVPNMYVITLMMVVLSGLIFIGLLLASFKAKS